MRGPETHAIIGAAMEVHNRLGCGFLEAVYQEALGVELAERKIPHQREVEFPIVSRGTTLANTYRAEVVCVGTVIVELKGLGALTTLKQAQLIDYLKASGLRRGLLINFGRPRLEHKRRVV